jgi:TonB family protein
MYPPLSRQAHIMGDVKVRVLIRKDGTVESGEVVSGHPMLKQAALDSAQKSQFECRGCGDELSSYSMIYTFGFLDDGKPIAVVTRRPVRSSKCLFLWKCGIDSGTEWGCPQGRPTEITESSGHVTILVSTLCVETEAVY